MQNAKPQKSYQITQEKNLGDPEWGNEFLDTTPKTQPIKDIIDKLNFIKIKNFCSAQGNIKRTGRQITPGKIILAKDIYDKGLTPNP